MSMKERAVSMPVPNLQTRPRVTVIVTDLEGKEEVFQCQGPAQVGPGYLLLEIKEGSVGFSLTAISKWKAIPSPISMVKPA